MLPIALNLSRLHVVLVGNGDALKRRLAQVREESPRHLTVFTEDNLPASPEEQGWHEGYAVIPRLPETYEIRQANVLMVVGLDEQKSAVLSSIARLQGVLVWVEDKPDLCDFYHMSTVRRGDLTIAVSTNGASPTLARELKAYLGALFDERWGSITEYIGEQRNTWRARGLSNHEVSERTRALITAEGWLNLPLPPGEGRGEGLSTRRIPPYGQPLTQPSPGGRGLKEEERT